jgi:hypothetical protein
MTMTALLWLALAAAPGATMPSAPVPLPAAAPIDDIAPHASGVCLAEVVDIKEHDARPGDGNLTDEYRLKILRKTGLVSDTISIVKAYGGLTLPGAPPMPKLVRPLWADLLKKGSRCWIAFTTMDLGYAHPINVWPEDAPGEAKRLDQAITVDLFSWSPEYDKETGFVSGHRVDNDKQWSIRVEKNGKVLWQKTIPGVCVGAGFWKSSYEDFPAKIPPCGRLMNATTTLSLEEGNEFGLIAPQCTVGICYDAETGVRVAARAAGRPHGGLVTVFQEYDAKTGKTVHEDRQEGLETGGLKVGAKTEQWYRRMIRTFDPVTGKVTGEEVFRYDEQGRTGGPWVKVAP